MEEGRRKRLNPADPSFFVPSGMARGCVVGLAAAALAALIFMGQWLLWGDSNPFTGYLLVVAVEAIALSILFARAWRTKSAVGLSTAALVGVCLLNVVLVVLRSGFPFY